MDSQSNPNSERRKPFAFPASEIRSPRSGSLSGCMADSVGPLRGSFNLTSLSLFTSPFLPFQSNVIRRMSSLGLPQIRLPSGSRLFWKKKRSAVISDVDPQYRVTYLGNVLTGWAKGEPAYRPSHPFSPPLSCYSSPNSGKKGPRAGRQGLFLPLIMRQGSFGRPPRPVRPSVRPLVLAVRRSVGRAGGRQRGEPFISRPIFSPLPHFAASFAPAGTSEKKGRLYPPHPLGPSRSSALLNSL